MPEQSGGRKRSRLAHGVCGQHGPSEARQPAEGRRVQSAGARPGLDLTGEPGERLRVLTGGRGNGFRVAHRAERHRCRVAQFGPPFHRFVRGQRARAHDDEIDVQAVGPQPQPGDACPDHLAQPGGFRQRGRHPGPYLGRIGGAGQRGHQVQIGAGQRAAHAP